MPLNSDGPTSTNWLLEEKGITAEQGLLQIELDSQGTPLCKRGGGDTHANKQTCPAQIYNANLWLYCHLLQRQEFHFLSKTSKKYNISGFI